jgi:16S rRNA (guanine(966)-N(2))-methyltransferase RsmD
MEGSKGKRRSRITQAGIRPTSSRVRDALFNILSGRGLERARVLDLYAGKGNLGVEALRQGASWCDFVESSAKLCEQLRRRLSRDGLTEKGKVYCLRVERALAVLEGPYDVVMMDPPYEMPGIEEVVVRLATSAIVGLNGILVVEHSRRLELAESYGDMKRWRSRRYGDTMLDIYVKGEASW